MISYKTDHSIKVLVFQTANVALPTVALLQTGL